MGSTHLLLFFSWWSLSFSEGYAGIFQKAFKGFLNIRHGSNANSCYGKCATTIGTVKFALPSHHGPEPASLKQLVLAPVPYTRSCRFHAINTASILAPSAVGSLWVERFDVVCPLCSFKRLQDVALGFVATANLCLDKYLVAVRLLCCLKKCAEYFNYRLSSLALGSFPGETLRQIQYCAHCLMSVNIKRRCWRRLITFYSSRF